MEKNLGSGDGGAEGHARSRQYDYRANSSLVLTTDSRPRDSHEPTGEPECLWGKIDPKALVIGFTEEGLLSWRRD